MFWESIILPFLANLHLVGVLFLIMPLTDVAAQMVASKVGDCLTGTVYSPGNPFAYLSILVSSSGTMCIVNYIWSMKTLVYSSTFMLPFFKVRSWFSNSNMFSAEQYFRLKWIKNLIHVTCSYLLGLIVFPNIFHQRSIVPLNHLTTYVVYNLPV